MIKKSLSGTNDLTEGSIVKKLILFFLPVAAGTLFQQLYNAVDALVVSKYVGTDALAAVGGTPATVISLVIGFCTALSGGCAVVISQLFGAKKHEEVTVAVKTAYVFCLLLGIVVGVVVILASPWLLVILKTPADTYDAALLYQRIYFAGSIFMLVFNMGSGILRAVGNSRFPFICLFACCLINIGLDLLFTITFEIGVAGVAWATVAAQGISAVMVTARLIFSQNVYHLRLREKFSHTLLLHMLRIGIPSGLQSSMYGISNLILQIGVNMLGTVVVASWAMSGKIDGFYWACAGAFGTTITTFIGQNYGAGNMKRIKDGTKRAIILFFSLTALLSVLLMFVGLPALHLLTEDADVIETTWYLMHFFVPVYILWSVIEVYSGVLRGIGDTVTPSVIIAVGICLVRIIWVLTVFRLVPTLDVLCICYPVSWALTDVPIYFYYKHREKQLLASKSDLHI